MNLDSNTSNSGSGKRIISDKILSELHQCQARLGLADEQLDDLARVCEIVHAMQNHLTAEILRRDVARLTNPVIRKIQHSKSPLKQSR
jgi:hypothetical protein